MSKTKSAALKARRGLARRYRTNAKAVESNSMKKLFVHMSQTVNRADIRRENRDDGAYIVIRSATLPDDVVMNGGLYPKSEIDLSFESLERTLAPIGHPHTASNEYISANDPYAVANFHIGAHNENVRREGGRIIVDKAIKVEMAVSSDKGKRLLDRIEAIENGGGKPIHTSTGVFLERYDEEGINSAGQKYTWRAANMTFDHDAILLDEEGAATPDQGVGIGVNAESVQVVKINLNESFDSTGKTVYNSNNANSINHKPKQGDKMKSVIVNALKEAGKTVEDDWTEAQLLDAYNSLIAEQVEKDLDGNVDVEAVVNAVSAKFKESLTAVVGDVESLKATVNASAEAEKAKAVEAVVNAGLLDKETAETLDVNALVKLAANHKPSGVANFIASGKPAGNSEGDNWEMVD